MIASRLARLRGRCRVRSYHSYDRPAPPGPFSTMQSQILDAALKHVPQHGFTARTLARAATDVGYLDATTNLFAAGPFSLVHYHLYTQRLALASASAAPTPAPSGRAVAWQRLQGNEPVIRRWSEAVALAALPTNVPVAVHELALLADEICFRTGDVAVDSTWYTHRAAVAAIYAASELFMTTDHSPGFRDTWDFLQRRFDEVDAAASAVGALGEWGSFTVRAALNVLRSKGMRI
ncbi:hypothetical protein K3495_g697 [Podosphaera aphanis]|nr:hypothetical protein K3495_g697 [Podosphaera aphanis]